MIITAGASGISGCIRASRTRGSEKTATTEGEPAIRTRALGTRRVGGYTLGMARAALRWTSCVHPRLIVMLATCVHHAIGATCQDWCNPWTLTLDPCLGCPPMEIPANNQPQPAAAAAAEAFDTVGSSYPGVGIGPVGNGAVGGHRYAGWVSDENVGQYEMTNGALKIQGDSRVYLVEDYRKQTWDEHKYVRLNLQDWPLRYTIDLSQVPCGCLACVYM